MATATKQKLKINKSDIAKVQIEDIYCLLYGEINVGKTTLCSHYDNTLFLNTLGGQSFVKVDYLDIRSWESFLDFLDRMEAGEFDQYRCFVVDVIDRLYRVYTQWWTKDATERALAGRYQGKAKVITHPGDCAHGKGWDDMKQIWQDAMYRLQSYGKGVTFIGHLQKKEIIENDVVVRVDTLPAIPATGHKFLTELCNFVFPCTSRDTRVRIADPNNKNKQIYVTNTERFMTTKGTESILAKDHTGHLPTEVPLDYAEFNAALQKALVARIAEIEGYSTDSEAKK